MELETTILTEGEGLGMNVLGNRLDPRKFITEDRRVVIRYTNYEIYRRYKKMVDEGGISFVTWLGTTSFWSAMQTNYSIVMLTEYFRDKRINELGLNSYVFKKMVKRIARIGSAFAFSSLVYFSPYLCYGSGDCMFCGVPIFSLFKKGSEKIEEAWTRWKNSRFYFPPLSICDLSTLRNYMSMNGMSLDIFSRTRAFRRYMLRDFEVAKRYLTDSATRCCWSNVFQLRDVKIVESRYRSDREGSSLLMRFKEKELKVDGIFHTNRTSLFTVIHSELSIAGDYGMKHYMLGAFCKLSCMSKWLQAKWQHESVGIDVIYHVEQLRLSHSSWDLDPWGYP